jgi:nucleoid-associated protein YgaU
MTNVDPYMAAESAQIAAKFASFLVSDPNAVGGNLDEILGGGSSPLGATPQQVMLDIEGVGVVTLDVNPDDVTLDKSQNTHTSKINRASSSQNSGSGGITKSVVGKTQYKGSEPGTLTIKGATLGSQTGVDDISEDIENLYAALVPPEGDESTSKPPEVIVSYGQWYPLPSAYLSKLTVKVTDWLNDGTPVRADIPNLVLTELSSDLGGQNPTSGAFGSRRTHTVVAGDSLASISYAEYGRPDYWRAIADVNGIDDPLRLRTGTELLIPPREFAKGKK